MSDFYSSVLLTALLVVMASGWKILMSPHAPTYQQWEVGFELLVSSIGVVFGSLITEETNYASTRLMFVIFIGAVTFTAALWAKSRGYGSAGGLSKPHMWTLNGAGGVMLIVTWFVNDRLRQANEWWHTLFP
uniref:Uncharacterized protein n=1 Tax=Streptomyces sp. F11 TaxID=319318 RepID=Q58IP2_9ACTN|nr:hypothetical protein [Streptomyces sp. F11]AAX51341.1 unknown [Streptomyces sp. F11]